jgi:hypothetical protein
MPPSKLSESDKHDILKSYQQTEETTTTLASRYGVSNSTIIRIIKSFISSQEYDALVQRKRAGRADADTAGQFSATGSTTIQDEPLSAAVTEIPDFKPSSVELPLEPTVVEALPPQVGKPKPVIRQLRRKLDEPNEEIVQFANAQLPLPLDVPSHPTGVSANNTAGSIDAGFNVKELAEVQAEVFPELGHSGSAPSDDIDEDDDLDNDLGDDEFDDEFDDGPEGEGSIADLTVQVPIGSVLEVLPLNPNTLPRTCYIVVDKTAELVTCPLKDFGELGQIPDAEVHQRILPVFDNHRAARRFSNRNQRIVKVPDGRMLSKTADHLHAKGISRLLIDGHIYALT